MTDELDRTQERIDAQWQQSLAPHLHTELSNDEIEQIALNGRDCAECGLPIPTARLRANPYAFRCIHCQQEWETTK